MSHTQMLSSVWSLNPLRSRTETVTSNFAINSLSIGVPVVVIIPVAVSMVKNGFVAMLEEGGIQIFLQ